MKFCAVFFMLLCLGCNHTPSKQPIELQVVRQSSNLIHCKLIFGRNTKKLYEENEIWLQTGTIDTADNEAPKQVAVAKIKDQPVYLYLANSEVLNAETRQMYTGNGYSLQLSYHESEYKTGGTFLKATCIITQASLKSVYAFEGMVNNDKY